MKYLKVFSVILVIAVLGFVIGNQTVNKTNNGQFLGNSNSTVYNTSQQNLSASQNPEITLANPKKLIIPKLNINADIEFVGNDSLGRMDVPKNADNTAWYKLGYRIGQKGNAVLAGHLDKSSGAPAVFYYLNKLAPGDEVKVQDESGKVLNFEVVKNQNYPWNEFPIDLVFGVSDKPMLNLITCDGVFDKTARNYSQRRVVFTRLKQS